MTATLWSLGAMILYGVVASRVGDSFPFSMYSMYARLRGRVEGAVLSVRVAGQEVRAAQLRDFVGVDPVLVTPDGYPCSQQWAVYEVQRWIAEHQATEAAADAVEVEVGFRVIRVEQFRLEERFVLLTAGSARWR